MKRIMVILALWLLAADAAQAQTRTMDSVNLRAQSDLAAMQVALAAYDNQRFDIRVINTDGVQADTMSGFCILQGPYYRCVMDSVEQVQNAQVHLSIHSEGKLLVVDKPQPFERQLFPEKMTEDYFASMNIDNVVIIDSAGYRKLKFQFLPEAAFTEYSIWYDAASYRVYEVNMKTKQTDAQGGYSATDYVRTRIVLSNFTTVAPGAVSFDVSPWIVVGVGNQITKMAAYTDYELLNQLLE